jgi:hypothetical protein
LLTKTGEFGQQAIICLQSCGCNPLVDAADDAEESNANCSDGKGNLRTLVTLERRQRRVGLCNVHRLHDKQIVVE